MAGDLSEATFEKKLSTSNIFLPMETTQLETARLDKNEMCFDELQTSMKRKQIENDFEHLKDVLG